ncbi:MAG: GNAT family N-acetyltransferase [Lewinellaceae bacterium]|nr:GNAT family N-acetyltransferase [Phaeodactylibacter sp.]MCB9035550.1 GNAT family N-acetyltransferase [Lewinellaceae bacterium]
MKDSIPRTPNLQFHLENNPELLTRLNRHVHTLHHEKHPDIFAPYDYEQFLPWYEGLLAQDNVYGIVAYLDEVPAGYALALHKQYAGVSPFHADGYELMQIDQMAIVPEYQHKGIGKKLIHYIREFCREKGINRLQLSVWLDNEIAKSFYEQMGFEGYLLYMEMKME